MAEGITHQLKISGPQMSTTFVVPEGTTTIGRHADNNLNFIHPLVSRKHAQLRCEGAECTIVDLNSTHGTTVNRQPLEPNKPTVLEPSDVVEIGAFWMLYERIMPAGSLPLSEPPASEASEPEEPEPSKALEALLEADLFDDNLDGEPEEEEAEDGDWERTLSLPASIAATPPPPPQIPGRPATNGSYDEYKPPPGLSLNHSDYIKYLPDIYWGNGNDFILRFLALLESIMAPIKWNVDNFDLYLDPRTAPIDFLSWLANWFDMTFDETWSEQSQRQLLMEAHEIYQRRGTIWALRRVLEIYTGKTPEIDDQSKSLDPFTFLVRVPLPERQVNRTVVERLIDANKPAHTSYQLLFQE